MKVRKLPVVVEAVQFDPFGTHKKVLPEGVEGVPSPGADNWAYDGCEFFIRTLEDISHQVPHRVMPGDWIITGVKGERYPCKPDIFEATYEKVEN